MTTTLVRAAQTYARLQRVAREALRATRELERVMAVEHFGTYTIQEDEQIDDEITGEVIDLLHLARETHPTQEIEVVVIAHSA